MDDAKRAELRGTGDHLVRSERLPGWAAWRYVVVRGSGFPFEWVLEMPACGAAADRVLDAEAAAARAWLEGLGAADRALDALRAEGGWGDEARRAELVSLRRGLVQREPGALSRLERVSASHATGLADALEALREEERGWARTYAECVERQALDLVDVASRDLFREAVLWQNPGAYRTGVMKLAAGSTGRRNSKWRQKEELVASYLQRYTTKNDTIGFFGPGAWATVDEGRQLVQLRAGPGLVRHRETFLEEWAVRTLAEVLAERRTVRRWLPPTRLPYLRVEGAMAYLPERPPMPLSAELAFLLSAADGERTAVEIAASAVAAESLSFAHEDEVLDHLDQLVAFEMIAWEFMLPFRPDALDALSTLIGRVEHEEDRRRCLDAVERLRSAKERVARCAGDADSLEAAIGELEATFEALTAESARRHAGRTYGARTVVYEDCLRDVEIELGPSLVEDLAGPMRCLLPVMRWASHRIVERLRPALRELLTRLAGAGGGSVDAVTFSLHLEREQLIEESVARAVEEASGRWSGCLPETEENARRVALDSGELAIEVAEAFGDAPAGWSWARHHAPDVMIAAPDVASIERGDYALVLGEVHPAIVTIKSWVFLALSPHRAEILEALNRDLREPYLHFPPELSTPVRTAVPYRGDAAIPVLAPYPSELRALSEATPLADLVVELRDDDVVVRPARGASWTLPLCQALSQLLTHELAHAGLPLFSPRAHRPRFTIDRLVVAREAWRPTADDLRGLASCPPEDRFLCVRRWMRRLGLPRFVFAKSSLEAKPFYVDFETPIWVDLFCKAVRRIVSDGEAGIELTEMLPAPDQLWLRDALGNHYTSELRLTYLDEGR